MTPLTSSNFSGPLGEISVFWRSDGEYSPSRVSELSRTSAFIKTPLPLPAGTRLDLRLDVPGREICAQAIVRRVVPGRGMGVEFESMTEEDRARLDLFVTPAEHSLSMQTPGEATASEASAGGSPVAYTRAENAAAGHPRHHRRAEQRPRLRYKFSAMVELTALGSARSRQARVAELGSNGCYVRMAEPYPLGTELDVSIAGSGQSFHARASVASARPGDGMGLVFAEIAPNERLILDNWLATAMERTWLASNRRQSRRIMVNIPVQVATKHGSGSEVSEETETISISAHGALLQLQMQVAKGQTLLLRNTTTKNALECSVDYLGSTRDGRREVGVSFVLPNQTLWQIAFPPEDWSPQHPDAKRA